MPNGADPDKLTLRVVQEADISRDLDAAIRACLVECFPDDKGAFTEQRWWHTRPAWTVIAEAPDAVVAGHLAMVERRVLVGPNGKPVDVAGVQSFAARAAWRATGLARRIMDMAVDEATRRGLDCGLLFCMPRLERLYTRMGWRKIDAAATMRDEQGRTRPIPGKNITMVRLLNVETFPQGDVDLGGADW